MLGERVEQIIEAHERELYIKRGLTLTSTMLDTRQLVAQGHDILLLTLDTLRYDVAHEMAKRGDTPNLCRLLPDGVWQKRHSPGSFTYAAHMAFFAGFLPTPLGPGRHDRLFAVRFPGSTTCIICSDHGTAYGEDGYSGHRIGHPVVWTVPFAEFVLANGARVT